MSLRFIAILLWEPIVKNIPIYLVFIDIHFWTFVLLSFLLQKVQVEIRLSLPPSPWKLIFLVAVPLLNLHENGCIYLLTSRAVTRPRFTEWNPNKMWVTLSFPAVLWFYLYAFGVKMEWGFLEKNNHLLRLGFS